MNSYGAITIGPIYNTICAASSPAALWFASTMFSYLAGDLCLQLKKNNDKGAIEVLVPAFDEKLHCKNGVGLWHDRIFFKSDMATGELMQVVGSICAEAKTNLADLVCDDLGRQINDKGTMPQFGGVMRFDVGAAKKFVENYIQISYIAATEERAHKGEKGEKANCILALSKYLDSLELTARFPEDETYNPFPILFNGDPQKENGSRNEYIKHSWLIEKCIEKTMDSFDEEEYELKTEAVALKNIQIISQQSCSKEDMTIRDIDSVANPDNEKFDFKKYKYFAVVQSDGDKMGATLKRLTDDEDVVAFSQKCIDYTKEAARLVGNYGGITIYAGGDDLLFLAPIEGKKTVDDKVTEEKQTILGLCADISEKFDEIFGKSITFSEPLETKVSGINERKTVEEKQETHPTLSFGISVNYYKVPLYDATKDAADLLFEYAKNSKEKNKIALSMHKHSGQSVRIMLPCDTQEGSALRLFDELIGVHSFKPDEKERTLHSLLFDINQFEFLLNIFSFDNVQREKNKDDCVNNERTNRCDESDKMREMERAHYKNIMKNINRNLFGEANAEAYYEYVEKVRALGDAAVLGIKADDKCQYGVCTAASDNGEMKKNYTDVMDAMLRLAKLYEEKGDDKVERGI